MLAIALATAGCSYLQFLPFLKSPVDARPKGTSSTTRGPAFASGARASRTPDAAADWPAYNNDPTGIRYSNLAQMNVSNAASLVPACKFVSDEQTPMQSGPVVVGGTMYLTSAINTYAIDAPRARR